MGQVLAGVGVGGMVPSSSTGFGPQAVLAATNRVVRVGVAWGAVWMSRPYRV